MGLSGAFGTAQAVCGAVQSRPWSPRPAVPIVGRQPAGLAASRRGDQPLRAMSRPSSVSPRPPAPGGGGGGGGGPAQCGPGGGARAKGLKDVRIDEEVKIAVNIALERFRYGDQRGEAPDPDRRRRTSHPDRGRRRRRGGGREGRPRMAALPRGAKLGRPSRSVWVLISPYFFPPTKVWYV